MRKRNSYFVAVMYLITFGIYRLYWLIVTRSEMVRKGAKIPSIFLILAPLLGLLVVVLLQIIVSFVSQGSAQNGFITLVNLLTILIGAIAFLGIIPVAIYWFYRYSKGVEFVTSGQTSFSFCFWWGLASSIPGLDFIWAGVIQNRFNKQITTTP